MKGRRIYAGDDGYLPNLKPGDYGRTDPAKMPQSVPEGFRTLYWQICAPNGHHGCLDPKIHTIVEHEDGTITVSPSILIQWSRDQGKTYEQLWHGFIERGVWREA